MPTKSTFRNYTGRRFARWIVLSYAGKHKREYMWNCLCDCGQKRTVAGRNMASGLSQSCGCYHRENLSKRVTTHGQSSSSEFRIWAHMLDRCGNPNDRFYKDYGGRGIEVCERWRNSFESFLADMGPRPSSQHSIDRHPDNNGNYEPGNCRWATAEEQANNKRSNHHITHNGVTLSIAQWERLLFFRPGVLKSRIRRGWPISKAIIPPSPSKPDAMLAARKEPIKP